ncbi:MAG: hypothetical protein RLZZ316_1767 [Bacteroidota bacterium]|jgi:outer membrane lipoprotein-sorting protein
MPKITTLLFAAFLSLTCIGLYAQTADDVINNYVTAMGGKEKLLSIKSIYMEGVSVMGNGTEISTKIYKVQDKLMRREISSAMFNMTQIITDKEGWFSNPRNGGAFEALPEDRLKTQQGEMDCAGPLVNYKEKGHTAEYLGKEDVEGTDCHKVKLTQKNGQEATYYFDAKTNLLTRETRKGGGGMGMGGGGGRRPGGGDGEVKMDYSNYQKTADGYLFAMTVTMGGMGAGMTYEKVEVNKPVDASLYKPQQ